MVRRCSTSCTDESAYDTAEIRLWCRGRHTSKPEEWQGEMPYDMEGYGRTGSAIEKLNT
jgi:5-methylcytosine-specific restriction endonuclease McrA